MECYRCDTCIHQQGEMANLEYPYPDVYCAKGHWEGLGDPDDPPEDGDPWADCIDFEEIE